MPDERHEQNNDGDQRDMIRQLRVRLGECEEERARLAAAAMSENSRLRAEVAMLSARLSDVVAMLAAQQQAAEQAAEATRAEGWRAGYDQRAAEESSGPPPAPGERHLRIVSFAPVAAVAGRVLRHKVALSTLAAGALIVATVPHWATAEFRVAVPGHAASPSVVAQAFAPQQGQPSPPPGHGKSPRPSPGSSHGHGHSPSPGPQGTPPGQATPSPSPDATTDPGTPSATPAPDPSGTPAAACTPG
jgi:hypothetical protein